MRAPDRPALSLDGEWRFVPDPERVHSNRSLPEGDPIQVPGVWESQVARPVRIITGWYQRRFSVQPEWRGRRISLRFGAVNHYCRAWLNGTPIGDHEGGYTPFSFEITDAIRWGTENRLVLRVVNPLNAIIDVPAIDVEHVTAFEEFEPDLPLSEAPHGKQTWYSSMSGPWQSIRLEATPPTFVDRFRVIPDVATGRVEVRWRLAGESPPAGTRLELRAIAPGGDEAATAAVALAEGVTEGSTTLEVHSPVLWDIDQPNLYQLEVRLIAAPTAPTGGDGRSPAAAATTADGDLLVDRFGMRTIAIADGRVLLNGRPIYLLGALDQDMYPDTIWNPPSREFLDDQVRKARELGLNLLRCHIKVPDPAYVEAADEAGILLWCELPNWARFTHRAIERGEETLETMVETLGNHPSIVIWTIINEDWGTELRLEARDRRWVKRMYHHLKAIDPTRLVVDNSPCDTPHGKNFHVRSDLADYHTYFGMPDNHFRWRAMIDDFASRPAWLWSPFGDAEPTGEEPLVISEFGNWGLPRLDRLWQHYGRQPWWFDTGRHYYRPMGLANRFQRYALDRIWPSVDALAEGTQRHQFQALQFEIGQMRRHSSIAGYVITELTDAFWEANGLLDIARNPKEFQARFHQINAPDVIVADLPSRDVWGGETLEGELTLSAYGPPPETDAVLRWRLVLDGGEAREGEQSIAGWPDGRAMPLGPLRVAVPQVHETTRARLQLSVSEAGGGERARDELEVAVIPRSRQRTDAPLAVSVHDPFRVWGLEERVTRLGHRLADDDTADMLLTSDLDEPLLRWVEQGGRALVLVRTRDAIRTDLDLARRLEVHLRRLRHSGWPGQGSPWEGDWINAWHWMLPGTIPGLPEAAPLDFAFQEVLPDHVLLGYHPRWHRNEVPSGMFVGWVHAPGATTWRFPQGRGSLTLTTFHLAPESGPVATVLLEGLMQVAAGRADLIRVRDRWEGRWDEMDEMDEMDQATERGATGYPGLGVMEAARAGGRR